MGDSSFSRIAFGRAIASISATVPGDPTSSSLYFPPPDSPPAPVSPVQYTLWFHFHLPTRQDTSGLQKKKKGQGGHQVPEIRDNEATHLPGCQWTIGCRTLSAAMRVSASHKTPKQAHPICVLGRHGHGHTRPPRGSQCRLVWCGGVQRAHQLVAGGRARTQDGTLFRRFT